jgi:transcriptional regulator with XRE-family HTH domain
MTRATTDYERIEADPAQRVELRKEELILAVTCALSEELERQGLTKMELADRMGTTRSHITQLLAGGRNLTLGSIAHMADALGCKVEMHLVPHRRPAAQARARAAAAKAKSPARRAPVARR